MQRSNRTPSSPPAELAVYDGQDHVDTIRRRDGRFIVIDARGRKLGAFTTLRNAMRVIPAAGRADAESK
jgi:hypothetical protein